MRRKLNYKFKAFIIKLMVDEAESIVTHPTKMETHAAANLVEEMRKTNTLTKVEQAERLEEIVQEAA